MNPPQPSISSEFAGSIPVQKDTGAKIAQGMMMRGEDKKRNQQDPPGGEFFQLLHSVTPILEPPALG